MLYFNTNTTTHRQRQSPNQTAYGGGIKDSSMNYYQNQSSSNINYLSPSYIRMPNQVGTNQANHIYPTGQPQQETTFDLTNSRVGNHQKLKSNLAALLQQPTQMVLQNQATRPASFSKPPYTVTSPTLLNTKAFHTMQNFVPVVPDKSKPEGAGKYVTPLNTAASPQYYQISSPGLQYKSPSTHQPVAAATFGGGQIQTNLQHQQQFQPPVKLIASPTYQQQAHPGAIKVAEEIKRMTNTINKAPPQGPPTYVTIPTQPSKTKLEAPGTTIIPPQVVFIPPNIKNSFSHKESTHSINNSPPSTQGNVIEPGVQRNLSNASLQSVIPPQQRLSPVPPETTSEKIVFQPPSSLPAVPSQPLHNPSQKVLAQREQQQLAIHHEEINPPANETPAPQPSRNSPRIDPNEGSVQLQQPQPTPVEVTEQLNTPMRLNINNGPLTGGGDETELTGFQNKLNDNSIPLPSDIKNYTNYSRNNNDGVITIPSDIKYNVSSYVDGGSGNVPEEADSILTKLNVKRPASSNTKSDAKKRQAALIEKLYREASYRQEYHNELAKIYTQYEMQNCTFWPTLQNEKAKGDKLDESRAKPPRDFDSFLSDQERFVKNLEQKRREIRSALDEEEVKGITFKPFVSDKSSQLAGKKILLGSNVHQRLFPSPAPYKISHELSINGSKALNSTGRHDTESSTYFKPQICNVSRQMVSHKRSASQKNLHDMSNTLTSKYILNSPGKTSLAVPFPQQQTFDFPGGGRHVAARSFHKREISGGNSGSFYNRGEETVLPSSKKVLVNKFLRQFDPIWEEVGNRTENVDILTLVTILMRFGFLQHYTPELATRQSDLILPSFALQEQILVHDLWHALKGNITKRNLTVFFLAILGLEADDLFCVGTFPKIEQGSANLVDGENQNEGHEVGENNTTEIKIGRFDLERNIYLNKEEIKTIQRVYDIFYINMLNAEKSKKANEAAMKTKKEVTELLLSQGSPQAISEQSRQMAEQYRQRLVYMAEQVLSPEQFCSLKPPGTDLSQVNIYALEYNVKKAVLAKKGEELKDEELKYCTFQPDLTATGSTILKDKQNETSNNSFSRGEKIGGLQHLYDAMNNSKYRTRQDRDKNEIEFEQQWKECTFQPKINPNNPMTSVVMSAKGSNHKRNKTSVTYAGSNEHQKENIEHGHIDSGSRFGSSKGFGGHTKHNSNVMGKGKTLGGFAKKSQGGRNVNSKSFSSNTGVHQAAKKALDPRLMENEAENIPSTVLCVDINMGNGHVEQLIIDKESNCTQIAKDFGYTHNLDEFTTGKLRELLESQLSQLNAIAGI